MKLKWKRYRNNTAKNEVYIGLLQEDCCFARGRQGE